MSKAFRINDNEQPGIKSDEPKSKKPRTLLSGRNNSVSGAAVLTDDSDIEDLNFLCSDVEIEDKSDIKGKGKDKEVSDDELIIL